MGNLLVGDKHVLTPKNVKCNRTYGDYGLNYICLVIGKV